MLIVIWVLSPLVLIPLLIHFINRSNRFEKFINNLQKQGRINNNEYFQAMRKMPPMQGGMPTPPNMPPMQGAAVPPPPPQYQNIPRGQPVNMNGQAPQNMPQNMQPKPYPQPYQPQGAPIPQPQPIPQPIQPPPAPMQGVPVYQNNAVPPVRPQAAYQPIPPQPQKTVSSSSVMLTVGVILVSIAGLIFASAVWTSMGGVGRTATIAFAAVFFYIISTFSKKKLSLDNSSIAFFSLGAVFSLITYLTAGYYELFGNEFSFEGLHKWGFVAGASAVVTVLAAIGYRIYKRKYLAVISISGAFAAFELLALDISGDERRVFSLLSSLALSACLAVVILIKGKPDWVADTLKVCAGLACALSVGSPLIYNFFDWRGADIATVLILFAIISLYAFKRGSKPMLSVHSLFVAMVALSAVEQICKSNHQSHNAFYILFFTFVLLGLIYRAFEKLRTPLSDNVFEIFAAFALLFMAESCDTSLSPVLCAAVMIGFMCIIALDKKPYSEVYGVLLPAQFVYIEICIEEYLTVKEGLDVGSYGILLLTLALAAVAGGLIYLGKKPIKLDISHIRGSFTICAAGASLFLAFAAEKTDIAERFLSLAVIIAVFAVTYSGKLQPISLFPAIKAALLIDMCFESVINGGGYAGHFIGALIAFALFASLSRIIFQKSILINEGGIIRLDTFAIGAAAALVRLHVIVIDFINVDSKENELSAIDNIVPLMAWGCATVLLLLLIREKNERSVNSLFAIGGAVTSFCTAQRLITFIAGFINDKHITLFIAAAIVFVCMCILSRVIFSRSLIIERPNGIIVDFFAAAAASSLMRMGILQYTVQLMQMKIFAFWIAAGVFLLVLMREKNGERANTVLKLLSAGAFLIAFIERPFLVSEEDSLELKITVIAIAIFGFAAKYILRKSETLADNFATVVHVFAMILLIGDALTHQSLANTLIVMSVAAVVMIISFIIKRKRWFLISACMLVGLTIYICKDFLASISWWVYLLLIGATLITIAVSNEYLKNKNDQGTLPEQKKKGRLFEEWKW